MSLSQLPPEKIVDVISALDYDAIIALCRSSSQYAQYCRSDSIWKYAMRKQYPHLYNVISNIKSGTYTNYMNNIVSPKRKTWKYYFKLLHDYDTEYTEYPEFIDYAKFGPNSNTNETDIFFETLNNRDMRFLYLLASDNDFSPVLSEDVFYRTFDMQQEEFDLNINTFADKVLFILSVPKFRDIFNLSDTLQSMITLGVDDVVEYIVQQLMTPNQVQRFITDNEDELDTYMIEYIMGLL
jgi:hypothetical protein